MKIDESYLGLWTEKMLDEGAFTVSRTQYAFSRLPVGLTLDQTISADAASRLTGVTSATNSYSARLRWMITESTHSLFYKPSPGDGEVGREG